jgi:hypothetical protein
MRKQRLSRKRIVNENVLISLIIYDFFNDKENNKHSVHCAHLSSTSDLDLPDE